MTNNKIISILYLSLSFLYSSILHAGQMERIEDENGKILTKTIVIHPQDTKQQEIKQTHKQSKNPQSKTSAHKKS